MKKTHDEWKVKGFFVLKGSNPCGTNEKGESLYSKGQVSKIKKKDGKKPNFNEVEDV